MVDGPIHSELFNVQLRDEVISFAVISFYAWLVAIGKSGKGALGSICAKLLAQACTI